MRDSFKILAAIIVTSMLVIFIPHLIDYYLQHANKKGFAPFFIFYSIDYVSIRNYIGSLSEVVTGLFGIIITVVAIIVNLSANRYTSKIIDLFIKDKLNIFVLILFSVIGISGIWFNNTIQLNEKNEVFSPNIEIIWYLIMISMGISIIVPYFFYVFRFLKPENIISKIQKQAFSYVDRVQKVNSSAKIKAALVESIEQLSEICKGVSISSDQSLGLQSEKALNRILTYYLEEKDKDNFPSDWYSDIDDYFLGLNKPIVRDLIIRRYWVEYKVFQEYESILTHFIGNDSRIAYQVAINTTEIGSATVEKEDLVVLNLITKYFNTFLKRSIEKKQIQTSVDILYQYYLFLKLLMESKIDEQHCLKIAEYFKYYGQYAVTQNMGNVLEFSSYFLRLINELAHELYSKRDDIVIHLLDLFLTVDDFPEENFNEKALIGVRQNQAILASFYLLKDDFELAMRIYEDMKDETKKRIDAIKESILKVDVENYFEIDNVGINPLFLQSSRTTKLIEFFKYFNKLSD